MTCWHEDIRCLRHLGSNISSHILHLDMFLTNAARLDSAEDHFSKHMHRAEHFLGSDSDSDAPTRSRRCWVLSVLYRFVSNFYGLAVSCLTPCPGASDIPSFCMLWERISFSYVFGFSFLWTTSLGRNTVWSCSMFGFGFFHRQTCFTWQFNVIAGLSETALLGVVLVFIWNHTTWRLCGWSLPGNWRLNPDLRSSILWGAQKSGTMHGKAVSFLRKSMLCAALVCAFECQSNLLLVSWLSAFVRYWCEVG